LHLAASLTTHSNGAFTASFTVKKEWAVRFSSSLFCSQMFKAD
jgi:hypothetical protein